MHGESKAGLSTYYIRKFHGRNVFDHIFDMFGQMDLNGRSSTNSIGFSKSLKKYWNHNYEFLKWEYVKHHLKQSDME